MSQRVAVLALAALILIPRLASGAPITIGFDIDSGSLHFGTAGPAQLDASFALLYGKDSFNAGVIDFHFESGPFLWRELTTNSSGTVVRSDYFYGPGTMTADITLDAAHGGVSGQLKMTLESWAIQINGEDDYPPEVEFISAPVFGHGHLDSAIAAALGVPRHVTGGWMALSMEVYDGTHSDPNRLAFGASGGEFTVPEPGALALVIVGLGAAVRFRRARVIALPGSKA
jgi:hypothetical protein